MKKILKTLIQIASVATLFGSFTMVASAQVTPPLSATFNPNPLFSASNFLPGDYKEAEIEISNNTESLQSAYLEAVKVSDQDNLGSQMNLEIFEGLDLIYNDNFEDFLLAGPVLLSDIESEHSKTYNLKITFLENSGDDYQSKNLGFDLCVRFSSSNLHCTSTTTLGPEQNVPSGGGGGGGGTTSGNHHLTISNEGTSDISLQGTPAFGTAIITWQTNIPSTSQVIYGLASGAPYTVDLNILPGLGYPLSTTENLTKVINHSVNLTGLLPGEVYVYRVVSRASPPSVSFEGKFTVPKSNTSAGAIAATPPPSPSGSVLGESSVNTGGEIEKAASTEKVEGEVAGASDINPNLAATFLSGMNVSFNYLYLLLLFILILIYFVWKKLKTSEKME